LLAGAWLSLKGFSGQSDITQGQSYIEAIISAADLVISAKEVPILPCYVVFLSQYPPDSSKNCGQLLHEWDVTSNS